MLQGSLIKQLARLEVSMTKKDFFYLDVGNCLYPQ